MIATICSSEKRPFRIAPSESGASLSTYRWSENLGAGHAEENRARYLIPSRHWQSAAGATTESELHSG
jgi:hypothetical protein